MAGIRSEATRGFTMYANAPVARHLRTKSGSEWMVKNTIFALQPHRRNSSAASIPLSDFYSTYDLLDRAYTVNSARTVNSASPLC